MEYFQYESRIRQIQAMLDSLNKDVDGLPATYREPISADLEALIDHIRALELNFPDLDERPSVRGSDGQPGQPAGELPASALQFEAILNNLIAGVVVFDPQGIVRFANGYAISLFGFDPNNLHRDSLSRKLMVYGENSRRVMAHEMPPSLAEGGDIVINQPLTIHSPLGRAAHVLVSAMPVYAGERLTSVVSVWNNVTELEQTRQQMEVHYRLLEYREKERQKIARDLHDGPVQSLGGLSFSLKVLQETTQDPAVQEMIEQIREDVKRQVKELREVCNELRPPLLAQFGLGKAIYSHALSFEEKHPGLLIILEMDEAGDAVFEALPENTTLALYRIYQEALNNVARHSQASRVTVRFALPGESIVFEIQDNGKGFQPLNDWVELARGGHYGLLGMKERAEAVGGIFTVESHPGKGTTIRVEIPRGT